MSVATIVTLYPDILWEVDSNTLSMLVSYKRVVSAEPESNLKSNALLKFLHEVAEYFFEWVVQPSNDEPWRRWYNDIED